MSLNRRNQYGQVHNGSECSRTYLGIDEMGVQLHDSMVIMSLQLHRYAQIIAIHTKNGAMVQVKHEEITAAKGSSVLCGRVEVVTETRGEDDMRWMPKFLEFPRMLSESIWRSRNSKHVEMWCITHYAFGELLTYTCELFRASRLVHHCSKLVPT